MWTAAYILSIVLVNWLFVAVPPLETPFGTLYLATLVVGAVFVLRDYAQREVKHYILLAMLAAGVLTGFMTTIDLAVASITAFAISELADWAIFSFTRRPLQARILMSSVIAVPLDTLAFLHLSGFLTTISFVTEVASKAVGVLAVWFILKAREERKLAGAA